MERRTLAASIVIAMLLAACTASAGGDPMPTPLAPIVMATTTTTTVAPTTTMDTSTTTTTDPPPSTTTTTTIPLLDRSDWATVERLQADLTVLLAEGPRVAGSPAEAAAADYVAAVAAEITGTSSRLQAVPLPGDATSTNVWVAGIGSGEMTLLLGAHIDSVAGAPGADDNGSGSILLLELLRRLAERPPAGLRVVVVWFGAEERIGGSGHHFGSRHAAEEMTAAGDLPDLMLSVDMVGVGDRLYSVGYRDHGASLADEVVAAAADVGIEATYVSRGEISDHVPFARAGVPAALLLRPDNPAWHKPSDDVVSDEVLLATLRVLEALVDRLDRAHRGLAPIRPTPPVG